MFYRAPKLTVKYLKEMIASDKFKDLPESTQLSYKLLLDKKLKRHTDRMKLRKAEKQEEAKRVAEAMKDIHVGDLFSASWGWEQTNVDFFQVVEIVGKGSVRVRAVNPVLLSSDEGMMCADRTYEIPQNGELLPPSKWSTFIKDNVRGDVKRIQCYGTRPSFKLSSFASAYKEEGKTTKHYESWYA